MYNKEENEKLIILAQSGNNEATEQLVSQNTPLVKSIVRRYKGRGVDYDDLFQLGCVGLLTAIRNFSINFDVCFSTYAVPMIAGEIKRFMRDDGSVKVSRAMKRTAKEINAFVAEYSAKYDRSPSIKEIAEKFNLEESETVFVMGSSKMPLSLYGATEYKDGNEKELIDSLPADDSQEDLLDKMLLKSAIEGLDERERKIIVLRYFRDMTQSEVAEQIGVSQVQISRIENKIIKEFRQKLGG